MADSSVADMQSQWYVHNIKPRRTGRGDAGETQDVDRASAHQAGSHRNHLRWQGFGRSGGAAQHSSDLSQDGTAGPRRSIAPRHARRRRRAVVRQPHWRQAGQTGADARLPCERCRGGRTAGAVLLILLLMLLLERLPVDECTGICAARARRQQETRTGFGSGSLSAEASTLRATAVPGRALALKNGLRRWEVQRARARSEGGPSRELGGACAHMVAAAAARAPARRPPNSTAASQLAARSA